MGDRRKPSDAPPPARAQCLRIGVQEVIFVSNHFQAFGKQKIVGSLPTAAHWPGGTPPFEGGVPRARWAEPNYPSDINKPAANRPNASEKFMTEATSMSVLRVSSNSDLIDNVRHILGKQRTP